MRIVKENLTDVRNKYTDFATEIIEVTIEGTAADLQVNDIIGDILTIETVRGDASHNGNSSIAFGIKGYRESDIDCWQIGRLVLNVNSKLTFKRMFTREELTALKETINLPEGCEYIEARKLDVGVKIFSKGTAPDLPPSFDTVTKIEFLAHTDVIVKMRVYYQGYYEVANGSQYYLFSPDEKVIVKSKADFASQLANLE